MAGAGGIRAGKAFVELATRDKLTAGLKKVQRQLRAFGNYANQVGRSLTAVGLLAGAGFAISTKALVAFDDRMRQVRAVTGATEQQFKALTEEARRLGAATSYSASEVAALMTELGRAGFTSTEIIDSTRAVLNLAKATSTELPRAGEIAGAALRAFGKDASEMSSVVDILTATANGSAQTLEDLFEAMKPLAPIASSAGESMEQTAAAIGVLANNGIKGSLAGNALARAYKNLSTEAGQADLRGIGVDAIDAAGNLRPMADIINDVAKATSRMPTGKRLAIFETLFGRGQAAALKLAESGQAFDALRTQIEGSSGIAAKTAAEMEAGLGGSFRRLLSAVESIAISIGKAIEKPLQLASALLLEAAGAIDTFVQKNAGLVAALAAGAAVAVTAGVALVGVGTVALLTASAVGGLVAVIGAASAVMGAILSPIGLVIAGVAAMGAAILKWSGLGGQAITWLGNKFSGLIDSWRPVIESIRGSLSGGDITGAAKVLWAALSVEWQKGVAALTAVWASAKHYFLTLFNELWAGARSAFAIGAHSIGQVWSRLIAWMGNLWDSFATRFQKGWETVTTFAAGVILDAQAKIDPNFSRDDAAAGKEMLAQQLTARKAELDSGLNERADGRTSKLESDLDAGNQKLTDQLSKIVDTQDKAQSLIDASLLSGLTGAQADLEAARVALNQAMAAAAMESGSTSAIDSPAGRMESAIDDMLAGLDGAVQTGLSSQGTFSAAAVASLGQRPLDQLVNIGRDIQQTNRKIARNSSGGGMTFT